MNELSVRFSALYGVANNGNVQQFTSTLASFTDKTGITWQAFDYILNDPNITSEIKLALKDSPLYRIALTTAQAAQCTLANLPTNTVIKPENALQKWFMAPSQSTAAPTGSAQSAQAMLAAWNKQREATLQSRQASPSPPPRSKSPPSIMEQILLTDMHKKKPAVIKAEQAPKDNAAAAASPRSFSPLLSPTSSASSASFHLPRTSSAGTTMLGSPSSLPLSPRAFSSASFRSPSPTASSSLSSPVSSLSLGRKLAKENIELREAYIETMLALAVTGSQEKEQLELHHIQLNEYRPTLYLLMQLQTIYNEFAQGRVPQLPAGSLSARMMLTIIKETLEGIPATLAHEADQLPVLLAYLIKDQDSLGRVCFSLVNTMAHLQYFAENEARVPRPPLLKVTPAEELKRKQKAQLEFDLLVAQLPQTPLINSKPTRSSKEIAVREKHRRALAIQIMRDSEMERPMSRLSVMSPASDQPEEEES